MLFQDRSSDEDTRRFRDLLAHTDPADYPAFLAKMREIVGASE